MDQLDIGRSDRFKDPRDSIDIDPFFCGLVRYILKTRSLTTVLNNAFRQSLDVRIAVFQSALHYPAASLADASLGK